MKYAKCQKYCNLSKYQESFNSVWDILTDKIIEECSSQAIGELIDAIWESWLKTKSIRDSEIIAEGAIYNFETQKMIELCQN